MAMDNLKWMFKLTNQMFKILCILIVGCFFTALNAAHADIFQCRGDANIAVFVDGASKSSYEHCRLIRVTISVAKNNNESHFLSAHNRHAKSDDGFPLVDKNTQIARDEKRKQILLSELS